MRMVLAGATYISAENANGDLFNFRLERRFDLANPQLRAFTLTGKAFLLCSAVSANPHR
jgi:hypothetical protein